MEALDYVFALIPALLLSFVLGVLIHWLTAGWHSNHFLARQNLTGPFLRALPWALAFAPVLMMKAGGGVLVPASLCLITLAYGTVFEGASFDTEEAQDIHAALTSIIVTWAALALLFFV